MNKDKQAFVYLWMDSKNKMWYLGSHCGNDPSYTHSSAVMESFTMRNKPHYMKRRILAYGSSEDIIQLEHHLILEYKLYARDDYYNLTTGFPFRSGPSNPRYIDGRSTKPDYDKEYRQRPEVIKRSKETYKKWLEKPGVMERVKEYDKEYRLKYYSENKEKFHEYWKERSQRPGEKERQKEYMKEWRQRPEVKERIKEYTKEYEQRPGVKERSKARRKEYDQRPEVKARHKEVAKEYNQRPEVIKRSKEWMKEWRQKPEVIEREKEYRQRPEVKARQKESYKKWYKKNRKPNDFRTEYRVLLDKWQPTKEELLEETNLYYKRALNI